jgi:hypothetical protein
MHQIAYRFWKTNLGVISSNPFQLGLLPHTKGDVEKWRGRMGRGWGRVLKPPWRGEKRMEGAVEWKRGWELSRGGERVGRGREGKWAYTHLKFYHYTTNKPIGVSIKPSFVVLSNIIISVCIFSDFSQKVTKICCIGAGYVGGPTCAMIAYKCPDITVNVVDKIPKRIEQWNSDNLPIFEVPSVSELLQY